ncbi:MAG: phytanoyl-CoA dioxygenase family protein [Myxococcota bacterium]|jgi:ectoine hydroxylase-related dioxygenase (phytanoyl-CoA dioxygenase family)|nr:phytanoyl-CoA dioxygenase family protein [Myxococcota bacterium]
MAQTDSSSFPDPAQPLRDLTREELDAYARDGAVCARGLIDHETIERMRGAIEKVTREEPGLGPRAEELAKAGFEANIFIWKKNDDFRDLALFSSLPHLAQQVLGGDRVNFFYEQYFVKRAGCSTETPWHQDIPFWPVSGSQIISFWITLDPVVRESSGLEFVRGSHRWQERYKAVTPDYDPYMMDSDLPEAPNFGKQRDEQELLGWDMEPGDVLLFGPVVCHGSEGNLSPSQDRRALAFRYSGEDVVFAPRHATMPLLWDHGLEPGERLSGSLFPQVWPRVIDAEVARRCEGEEPPSPAAVGAFFKALEEKGFGPGGKKPSLFS